MAGSGCAACCEGLPEIAQPCAVCLQHSLAACCSLCCSVALASQCGKDTPACCPQCVNSLCNTCAGGVSCCCAVVSCGECCMHVLSTQVALAASVFKPCCGLLDPVCGEDFVLPEKAGMQCATWHVPVRWSLILSGFVLHGLLPCGPGPSTRYMYCGAGVLPDGHASASWAVVRCWPSLAALI